MFRNHKNKQKQQNTEVKERISDIENAREEIDSPIKENVKSTIF